MDHVTQFTSMAQEFGAELERGLRVFALGATHGSVNSFSPVGSAPSPTNSSGLLSPKSRGISPPPSGEDNIISKQLRELTLAVCQYASQTNNRLNTIQSLIESKPSADETANQ